MLPIIIKDFSRLNLAIKPKFHKKKLLEFYEAVVPIFARAICLNFGGCWRSDFGIFSKNFSIDLLHRSWNGTYFFFFWIDEIANLSNVYFTENLEYFCDESHFNFLNIFLVKRHRCKDWSTMSVQYYYEFNTNSLVGWNNDDQDSCMKYRVSMLPGTNIFLGIVIR